MTMELIKVLEPHQAAQLATFLTHGTNYPAHHKIPMSRDQHHYLHFTRTGDGKVTIAHVVPDEWLPDHDDDD